MSVLQDNEFEQISAFAKRHWGLHITERKRMLVENRLQKFVRNSPYDTVQDYLEFLRTSADDETKLVFFDLLSTNVTSFFRENQHFNYLEREFYTGLTRGNITVPNRRLRFWSAACSIGAEPYSMAIHAHEHLPDISRWDFKILATDLSNSAVAAAKKGVYQQKLVEHLDQDLVERHFDDDSGGDLRVAPHIREMVRVARLNLMEDWPMDGPLDVIFCRNVMIYFDRPTRENIVRRMYDLLRPGGLLAIGSAETLSGIDVDFRPVQPSLYVK